MGRRLILKSAVKFIFSINEKKLKEKFLIERNCISAFQTFITKTEVEKRNTVRLCDYLRIDCKTLSSLQPNIFNILDISIYFFLKYSYVKILPIPDDKCLRKNSLSSVTSFNQRPSVL